MGNPANKPKLNGGRDSVHAHVCVYTCTHTHENFPHNRSVLFTSTYYRFLAH